MSPSSGRQEARLFMPTPNAPSDLPRTATRRFSGTLDALLQNLSNTGRGRKQLLSVAVDGFLTIFCLWLAYSLRHGIPFSDFRSTWHLFLLLPLVTVTLFGALGIYRWVVRSSSMRLFRQIGKGAILSGFALVLLVFLLPPDRATPRSLFVIYGVFLLVGAIGVRLVWKELFDAGRRGEPVAIYGAGAGGRQLAGLLDQGREYRPVAFVDDDASLRGTTMSGLPVLDGHSVELKSRLRSLDVGRIVLAIPSLPAADYRRLLDRVEPLGLTVQTMPSVDELVSGQARPDEIRDISIDDILGRTEVAPDLDLIGRRVIGKTVLVTGGGGSIGSELCRQIARLSPRRLIVLDSCEANLYHITEELDAGALDFVPHLGDVTDRLTLERLMDAHAIDTVYHAAAYKHVPIIEAQPAKGVETNVFGTLGLLETAISRGVADFVLISTDKAVRPANAMGASKRAAELVLQAKARSGIATRVSMVRFGNVLGSSGSVVPKFKKQIEAGGPITLTDFGITRFFMTIPEAAQLVLQASAIAEGGDVFVLDMGEPVLILELARSMVRLYGRRLTEETGDARDIAIVETGLRPGEKMYEELFITDSHRPTRIAKVFTADEAWLPWAELESRLADLVTAIDQADDASLRTTLMTLALEGRRDEPTRVVTSDALAANDVSLDDDQRLASDSTV